MYKISYKTELHVGKGALQQLSHYKNEHILVVADPFLKTSGTLDAILANFDDNNDIVVFTDIVPDPPIENGCGWYQECRRQANQYCAFYWRRLCH